MSGSLLSGEGVWKPTGSSAWEVRSKEVLSSCAQKIL